MADKQTQTFLGIIAAIVGLFMAVANPWDFKTIPSTQSIIGFALLIIGLLAAYNANK
ncbi:MAG: hypothetical protein AABX75_02495 [Nanoarchaeota archaeon]